MAIERKQVYAELKEMFGQVPEWFTLMPDSAIGGFWTLFRDFELSETRIPSKYKELIGIAVSGATRCKYCTLFHTEAARLAGATDEELAEAAMMGAVTMAGSTFLNAQQVDYDGFRRETLEMVEWARGHTPQASASAGASAGTTFHA